MGEKRMLKDLRAEFLTQALQSKQSFWKNEECISVAQVKTQRKSSSCKGWEIRKAKTHSRNYSKWVDCGTS